MSFVDTDLVQLNMNNRIDTTLCPMKRAGEQMQ